MTSGTQSQRYALVLQLTTVYTFGGATDATMNLPTGLTSVVDTAAKTVTISGTPTASGTYNNNFGTYCTVYNGNNIWNGNS
jgi:hypothetical protein